jgi:GntR family phosphonate transport system transcriptional regulator
MASLHDESLVRIEQGRGTFVREDIVDYRIGRRTRFTENLARHHRQATHELIEFYPIKLTAQQAGPLGLRAGGRALRLDTVSFSDSEPISVTESYLPLPRFEGLGEVFEETRSITKALQRFGVEDYLRKWSRVTAAMPSLEESTRLRVPRSQPLLLVESVNVDREETPIQYSLTRFATPRVQLVFEP